MSAMKRIFQLMVEKKASDVYLSAHAPALIKINGLSVPFNNQVLDATTPINLLSEVISSKQMEELKETGELNIAFKFEDMGNFRISAMRQRGTYAAVIRFIPLLIPPLHTLNVPDILAELVVEKLGLILMVGATGAGKSTTLASMLDHRNERMTGHILTVEDPIEYFFTPKKSVVNQREVGTDTQSLQTALRNGLRQAPDVFFIGEIRDRETMAAALAYAQTGHLCIATLHANNSHHALNRILSFFPVEVRPTLLSDLSTTLRAVVSQRLLRTKLGSRAPAVEVLLNTQLIAEMIAKGDFFGVKEAMDKSMAQGSQTFEDDIARLIHADIIEREEGLAYADSPTNLIWRLDNTGTGGSAVHEEAKEQYEAPSFTHINFS
ncbi:MAG: PilT/PilU family type 4a pilus ATPase [Burkholderiaceae bacterium]|nr:PilT/PilU family type 4a pilus ATPase [Burkholderiaceae bacterium]